MARYALERMPAPEAAQALRDALPRLCGALKVGVIGSLGVRHDSASVPALVALLGDADKTVARAAAYALGDIGSLEAAQALGQRLNNAAGRREVGDRGCLSGVRRAAVGRRQNGRRYADL